MPQWIRSLPIRWGSLSIETDLSIFGQHPIIKQKIREIDLNPNITKFKKKEIKTEQNIKLWKCKIKYGICELFFRLSDVDDWRNLKESISLNISLKNW